MKLFNKYYWGDLKDKYIYQPKYKKNLLKDISIYPFDLGNSSVEILFKQVELYFSKWNYYDKEREWKTYEKNYVTNIQWLIGQFFTLLKYDWLRTIYSILEKFGYRPESKWYHGTQTEVYKYLYDDEIKRTSERIVESLRLRKLSKEKFEAEVTKKVDDFLKHLKTEDDKYIKENPKTDKNQLQYYSYKESEAIYNYITKTRVSNQEKYDAINTEHLQSFFIEWKKLKEEKSVGENKCSQAIFNYNKEKEFGVKWKFDKEDNIIITKVKPTKRNSLSVYDLEDALNKKDSEWAKRIIDHRFRMWD